MRWIHWALPASWLGLAIATRLSLKSPTAQALHQVQAEAKLLQGFRTEVAQDPSSSLGAVENPLNNCDVSVTGAVCFSGQRKALMPSAVQSGLVGHWTFDEKIPVDASGNGNHAATEVLHGPTPAGAGHSALFKGNHMTVPNSVQFQFTDFSYSFWVYLLDDETGQTQSESAHWCTLLRKGIYDTKTQQFASAPSISYSPQTGHLRASISTSLAGTEDGEHMQSNARLGRNRWMHVAIVHHSAQNSLLLYVNGILDAALSTQGVHVTNTYPLYVGGDPFSMGQCNRPLYMDDLRAFARPLAPHELKSQAALALGGTDPSYVRLGCTSCNLVEAVQSCPPTRHVCTSLELHTGGYQVARSLGWLQAGTHVWTHAACAEGAAAPQQGSAAMQVGLALCCEGNMAATPATPIAPM